MVAIPAEFRNMKLVDDQFVILRKPHIVVPPGKFWIRGDVSAAADENDGSVSVSIVNEASAGIGDVENRAVHKRRTGFKPESVAVAPVGELYTGTPFTCSVLCHLNGSIAPRTDKLNV